VPREHGYRTVMAQKRGNKIRLGGNFRDASRAQKAFVEQTEEGSPGKASDQPGWGKKKTPIFNTRRRTALVS